MKTYCTRMILICAWGILSLHSQVKSQVTDPSFDTAWAARFQQAITTVIAEGQSRGVSVALIVPEQGLFIGTAGESAPGVPISSDMRFGIGSNSKLFTNVLILKLQELGLLSIDDPISDYLPVFPNVNPSITIRQLMSHQSGLFDFETELDPHDNFFENMNSFVYGPDTFYYPEDVLGMIGAPHFAPGESYAYNNTGYLVLAMIVEAVSGASFADNLHQYILDPLELNQTFLAAYEAPNGPVAHGWHLGDDLGDDPTTAPHSMYLGSGSIFSTANDMVHWYDALFAGEVLTQASMDVITDIEPASMYGHGVWMTYWPSFVEDAIYTHGGWVPGYTSDMGYDVERRSPLCILANDENDYAALVAMLIEFYENAPRPALDAAVLRIDQPKGVGCAAQITPVVELKNYGSDPLTSVELKYKIDNGIESSMVWTGILLTDETVLVTLPMITVSGGAHTLQCRTMNPNGEAEGYFTFNDAEFSEFIVEDSGMPYGLAEGFEGTLFPPAGWLAGDGRKFDWGKCDIELLSGNGSVVKHNWSDGTYRSYYLDLPMLDLTTLVKPELRFTYAYGYYGEGAEDSLAIEVSSDCGETYQTVFYKGGLDLMTADAPELFVPSDDQWKTKRINLSAFKKKEILIRFKAINSWGNNLYLDDIVIAEKQYLSHQEPMYQALNGIHIYPNPAADCVRIDFVADQLQQLRVSVTDSRGSLIHQALINVEHPGEQTWNWNSQTVPPGIYMVSITGDAVQWAEKLTIMK